MSIGSSAGHAVLRPWVSTPQAGWRVLLRLALLVVATCTWAVPQAEATALTLQVLHASDFEAAIAALDDAPRFSAVVNGLRAQYPTNTLVLSSGDNYTAGPFYSASADPAVPFNGVKGRGDLVILDAIGIQAACFGNHEFDDGTAQVRSLIRADSACGYPGAHFPYLSANLNCNTDGSLSNLVTIDAQEWTAVTNRIARSAVIPVAGDRVGVVGVTTPELTYLTQPGGITVSSNLAGTVQPLVDDLVAQGIDKIVILSHLQQLTNEWLLATQLTNVDVIVAGGSHALLAKPTDRLRAGDTRLGDYPLTVTGPDGRTVYIVNTAANYHYVGRLLVQFDAQGIVTNLDARSGAYATDDQGVLDTGNYPPAAAVTSVVSQFAAIIDSKDSNWFGRTRFYLNGLRESVRTRETNLGDLALDALLHYGRQHDSNVVFALKNSGSIRDSIGATVWDGSTYQRVPPLPNPRVGKQSGQISQLDIENAIRFNNGVILITLTAAQVRDAVEWGVAGTGLPGQFPQVSGIEFAFNPTNPAMTYLRNSSNQIIGIDNPGQRLRSLVARRADGYQDLLVEHGQLRGDSNRPIRMVTLDFLAAGGDNYYPLTLGVGASNLFSGATNTFDVVGHEQYAFAMYLTNFAEVGAADTEAPFNERLQNLAVRGDTVPAPELGALARNDGHLEFTTTTLTGKTYAVQAASGIIAAWEDVPGTDLAGDGWPHVLAVTNPPFANAFFRVSNSHYDLSLP